MEIRNFVRAWLAFTVLQLIGNLWQCTQLKTFSTNLLRKEIVRDTILIAALFFLHHGTVLLLRLFVIYSFDCIPLQVFHIVCTAASAIFFIFETFYAQMLNKSFALCAQIAFSGGTVLLILSTWKWLFVITQKAEKKRRKITALHVMGRDLQDLSKQS